MNGRQLRRLLALIVPNLLFVLTLVPWFYAVPLGKVELHETSGWFEWLVQSYVVVTGIGYPLILGMGIVYSWRFYKLNKSGWSVLLVSLIPLCSGLIWGVTIVVVKTVYREATQEPVDLFHLATGELASGYEGAPLPPNEQLILTLYPAVRLARQASVPRKAQVNAVLGGGK